MATMTDQNLPNLTAKFSCTLCDYNTNKQSKFNEHLLTAKHKRLTSTDPKKTNITSHICHCGKYYKFKQGLHKHKKTCDEANGVDFKDTVVIELLKQNKMLMELLKQNNTLIELSKEETHPN
jgi:hypothetical protein